MGDDQRLDRFDRKADRQALGARAIRPSLGALEQTAVDQQRAPVGEPQFMAGAGDAIDGAVVEDVHLYSPC